MARRPSTQDRTDRIREALQETGGAIAPAARRLGLSRRTVERHLQKNSELRLGSDLAKMKAADDAWRSHLASVEAGRLSSLAWHLDNRNFIVTPEQRPMTASEQQRLLEVVTALLMEAEPDRSEGDS